MSETEELIARIDAAMARLKKLAEGATELEMEGETLPLFRKVRRLNRANATLNQQLEVLQAKRERDISELDALVAQLKPLLGEDV